MEWFNDIKTAADHKELKKRWVEEVQGKVQKIRGDIVEWEEDDNREEPGQESAEGEDDEGYDEQIDSEDQDGRE